MHNANPNTPVMRPFTVWDCRSPTSGERARLVRPSHPDDHRHAHDYQRIAWRGLAHGEADAMARAAMTA